MESPARNPTVKLKNAIILVSATCFPLFFVLCDANAVIHPIQIVRLKKHCPSASVHTSPLLKMTDKSVSPMYLWIPPEAPGSETP